MDLAFHLLFFYSRKPWFLAEVRFDGDQSSMGSDIFLDKATGLSSLPACVKGTLALAEFLKWAHPLGCPRSSFASKVSPFQRLN